MTFSEKKTIYFLIAIGKSDSIVGQVLTVLYIDMQAD